DPDHPDHRPDRTLGVADDHAGQAARRTRAICPACVLLSCCSRLFRRQLAPAGFYFSRGIRLFGVQLVYGIVLSIIPGILEGIGSAMQQSNGSGVALLTLGYLLNLVAL